MSTVVVTGGAGFVGSHVAELLRDRGHEVTVVDDLSSGKRENVPEGCRLVELDITDAAGVHRAIDGATFVCHLAAQASVTVSVKEPDRDLAINVAGTLNVCTAAAAAGAPVVFASTGGALYGDNAPIPTPETAVTEPLAPYGASKLAGEAYVGTWSRLHDVGNVVLRLGNVYGPPPELRRRGGRGRDLLALPPPRAAADRVRRRHADARLRPRRRRRPRVPPRRRVRAGGDVQRRHRNRDLGARAARLARALGRRLGRAEVRAVAQGRAARQCARRREDPGRAGLGARPSAWTRVSRRRSPGIASSAESA